MFGFLRDMYKNTMTDNRVKTAKDPNIQRMLDYMYDTYGASIEAFFFDGKLSYHVCCGGKDTFDLLFQHGLFEGSSIRIPGMGSWFDSKVEAFQALLWLYDFLEEKRTDRHLDDIYF